MRYFTFSVFHSDATMEDGYDSQRTFTKLYLIQLKAWLRPSIWLTGVHQPWLLRPERLPTQNFDWSAT